MLIGAAEFPESSPFSGRFRTLIFPCDRALAPCFQVDCEETIKLYFQSLETEIAVGLSGTFASADDRLTRPHTLLVTDNWSLATYHSPLFTGNWQLFPHHSPLLTSTVNNRAARKWHVSTPLMPPGFAMATLGVRHI
jgi:hypothetical protein